MNGVTPSPIMTVLVSDADAARGLDTVQLSIEQWRQLLGEQGSVEDDGITYTLDSNPSGNPSPGMTRLELSTLNVQGLQLWVEGLDGADDPTAETLRAVDFTPLEWQQLLQGFGIIKEGVTCWAARDATRVTVTPKVTVWVNDDVADETLDQMTPLSQEEYEALRAGSDGFIQKSVGQTTVTIWRAGTTPTQERRAEWSDLRSATMTSGTRLGWSGQTDAGVTPHVDGTVTLNFSGAPSGTTRMRGKWNDGDPWGSAIDYQTTVGPLPPPTNWNGTRFYVQYETEVETVTVAISADGIPAGATRMRGSWDSTVNGQTVHHWGSPRTAEAITFTVDRADIRMPEGHTWTRAFSVEYETPPPPSSSRQVWLSNAQGLGSTLTLSEDQWEALDNDGRVTVDGRTLWTQQGQAHQVRAAPVQVWGSVAVRADAGITNLQRFLEGTFLTMVVEGLPNLYGSAPDDVTTVTTYDGHGNPEDGPVTVTFSTRSPDRDGVADWSSLLAAASRAWE